MATKTQIVRVNLNLIERDKIEKIVNVLKKGGIVVYPTDTFYGLGVNGYLIEAVKKIYTLKGRDPAKPISLVVSDLAMVRDIAVEIPPVFQRIVHHFWPGPLTIVFRAADDIPAQIKSSEGSVGIRWPDLLWLRELIKRADFPLTATSANLTGKKEVSDPDAVIKAFFGKVDLIVDAGKSPGGLPSTVIDLTKKRPRILREGAVPSSELRQYFEEADRD